MSKSSADTLEKAKIRADEFFKKGEFENAVREYTEAITLSTVEVPEYFIGRGNALVELGRFEEALRDLDKAVQLEMKLGPTYGQVAAVYSRLGDYVRAVKYYKKAILYGICADTRYYRNGLEDALKHLK